MGATLTLIDLAGAVPLLIWGVHMVQTGVTRAFGPSSGASWLMRSVVSLKLSWQARRSRDLQSSTATELITTTFAAGGLVELVPALVVMLGANVRTTLYPPDTFRALRVLGVCDRRRTLSYFLPYMLLLAII